MKVTVFGEVIACCMVDIYRRFVESYFIFMVEEFYVLKIETVCPYETL